MTNLVDRAVGLRTRWRAGVRTVWFGQAADYDAPPARRAGGSGGDPVFVGTSVVPIYPRHPLLLAAAAKTGAGGCRRALPARRRTRRAHCSRAAVRPAVSAAVQHLREYLTALRPLLDGDDAAFVGQTLTSRPVGATAVAGASRRSRCWWLRWGRGPSRPRAAGRGNDSLPRQGLVPSPNRSCRPSPKPPPRPGGPAPQSSRRGARGGHRRRRRPPATASRPPSASPTASVLPGGRGRREGLSNAADLLIAGDEATVTAAVCAATSTPGPTKSVITHTDLFGRRSRARTWAIARLLGLGTEPASAPPASPAVIPVRFSTARSTAPAERQDHRPSSGGSWCESAPGAAAPTRWRGRRVRHSRRGPRWRPAGARCGRGAAAGGAGRRCRGPGGEAGWCGLRRVLWSSVGAAAGRARLRRGWGGGLGEGWRTLRARRGGRVARAGSDGCGQQPADGGRGRGEGCAPGGRCVPVAPTGAARCGAVGCRRGWWWWW
ncbi:hypothetical protein SRIMM317S_07336 [Streptomyces rimosus subsp. rimosus]